VKQNRHSRAISPLTQGEGRVHAQVRVWIDQELIQGRYNVQVRSFQYAQHPVQQAEFAVSTAHSFQDHTKRLLAR
jgi:hypothetical protein